MNMIHNPALCLLLVFGGSACDKNKKDEHPQEGAHAGHSHDAKDDAKDDDKSAGEDAHEGEHAEGEEHGGHDEHEEGVVELSPDAAQRLKIRVVAVERRALPNQLTTTGEVDFDEGLRAHVSPRMQGRVHEVRVDLGHAVKPGQTLAVLDSIDFGKAKAEYLQARSRAELAAQTLEREEKLLAEKITSEQEVLAARSAHNEARSALNAAAETLYLFGLGKDEVKGIRYGDPSAALFPIRAPFAGKIIDKHITKGELVGPESNLFTIANLDSLWVWTDVYEKDLGKVHVGDGARIEVDAFPGVIFEGKVSYLRDEVDSDTRTVRARVDVDNAKGLLKPKMFVRVVLSDPHAMDGSPAQEGLVVPESALQREGDGFILFVQEGERRYEGRKVSVGRRSQGMAEVLEGVAAEDRVVADGAFLLKSEAAKESMGGGHSH